MAASLLPAGPRGHLLAGNLPEFRRDPLGALTRWSREHGDFVPLDFAWRKAVLLSDPDYIEQVLVANARNFTKGRALRRSRFLLGEGLLTSEGDLWRRQRRLIQPAFHRTRIDAYADVMVARTVRMLEGWQDGEIRDIHEEMMHLTLEIVAKTLFDADVSAEAHEVGEAMRILVHGFMERTRSLFPVPERIPTPANLRLMRAVHRLESVIYGIIGRRRAEGGDRGDLLSMLLQARDEHGNAMSDRQVRDEVMTLFLAGHETTAIALSWTWYLLSQHREAEAKLAAELRAVLRGRPPAPADLPHLPYTRAVVSESLRLYPPAWLVGRRAIVPTEIGGYLVPPGTVCFMSQWVMHRDPRYFDHPERFDPDRWAGDLARRLPRFAYFPFGGGPRLCVGAGFATTEAALLLATIAQRFRLSLTPGQHLVPEPSITLRPKQGLAMMLELRDGS